MGIDQLGELRKYFYHLVGAFAAGGNNHDVGFSLLGNGVLKYCFSRAEKDRE